jgi:integrase
MIPLPYVQTFRDRIGKIRRYYRRGSRRVALPGLPGSPEFMAAYAAAQDAPAPSAPAVAPPGSIAALVTRYYSSGEYRRLAPGTREQYRRTLDRFVAEHGHRPARQMKRAHVDAIVARMSDGAGHYFLKRLRALMRFAVREDLVIADPTAGVALPRIGEHHTWTDDELAAFEAIWPVGTKQRLAYALILYTGQRVSDACRLGWPDANGFRVRQQKTGAALIVPVHPALAAVLEATPKRGLVVMLTEYGQPFSTRGFGNLVSDAIRKAGLPSRCVAHGLRKAAARRLAEAGATEKQIAAITGHKTLAEVERYTRAADQVRLARDAMEKQAENDRLSNRLSNSPPRRTKSKG